MFAPDPALAGLLPAVRPTARAPAPSSKAEATGTGATESDAAATGGPAFDLAEDTGARPDAPAEPGEALAPRGRPAVPAEDQTAADAPNDTASDVLPAANAAAIAVAWPQTPAAAPTAAGAATPQPAVGATGATTGAAPAATAIAAALPAAAVPASAGGTPTALAGPDPATGAPATAGVAAAGVPAAGLPAADLSAAGVPAAGLPAAGRPVEGKARAEGPDVDASASDAPPASVDGATPTAHRHASAVAAPASVPDPAAALATATPTSDAPAPQPMLVAAPGLAGWHLVPQTLAPAAAPVADAAAIVRPEAVAGQVAIAVGKAGAARKIELRLDPPELGRVEIHLTPTEKGGVHATVVAERADTHDLLRRHGEVLARELGNAGYSGVSLSFSAGGDAATGRNLPAPVSPDPAFALATDTGETAAPAAVPRPLSVADGGLDIRL
ncbi:MAG: flagellar hook-length control protein FliK [Amaricoccus sp.]|uniref:flagellar hook-length control protein FliK n=1 Tax=Amaricoccus sp. TaxID=1872485 RepID=UPI0039E2774E